MAGGQEAIFTCSSATVDIEQLLTIEEDTKHHSQLVEGLAEDILGHGGGYQRRGSAVRFSQQQVWSWKLCGESKAGEGVHDQVDPEHLNSLQDKPVRRGRGGEAGGRHYLEWTVLYGTGSNERNNDGNNVHGQLELEKLGDAVVDISPPHHGLDDAGEVVIGQNDVRGLLGHVSASYAHGEANVSFL